MTDSELIRAVAEKVMGWELLYLTETDYPSGPHWKTEESYWPVHEWNPLSNANHWMMVVERMRELWWYVEMSWLGGPPDGWRCRFFRFALTNNNFYAYNDNLGHAICEAALQALDQAGKG